MELRSVIKDILRENQGIRPKNLKERSFNINILLDKKADKINSFTGFRRVGKTYLLFLIMESLKDKSCIYFNFEDERIPESTDVLTQLIYAVEEIYPDQDHILLITLHHIVTDGWSRGIIQRDLAALYNAQVLQQTPTLRRSTTGAASGQSQHIEWATLPRLFLR